MRQRHAVRMLGCLLLGAAAAGCVEGETRRVRANDLAEATQELERNIAAIQRRDTEAYLQQYLDSPELVVASADSLRRGYLLFAEARRASDDWPDTLIAGAPTVVWIAPGVGWGAFEFAAVVNQDTAHGWSERIFLKTPGGWKIAVTGMMQR